MTTLSALARPELATQPVYEPGKPIEDVARELGLAVADITKLASNENPFGASPLGMAAAQRAQSDLDAPRRMVFGCGHRQLAGTGSGGHRTPAVRASAALSRADA